MRKMWSFVQLACLPSELKSYIKQLTVWAKYLSASGRSCVVLAESDIWLRDFEVTIREIEGIDVKTAKLAENPKSYIVKG